MVLKYLRLSVYFQVEYAILLPVTVDHKEV